MDIKNAIKNGNTTLGIEFGSTRIKAVLNDSDNNRGVTVSLPKPRHSLRSFLTSISPNAGV